MTRNRVVTWKWRRYFVAVALVAAAAAMRVWPLQSLGSRMAWLTFYPVVMVAAIYGGLAAGLLAASLACLINLFLGPLLVAQPFIKDAADWLGMAIFGMTSTMISGVSEAMRRAQMRAKQAQEKAEAANKAKSAFLASMSHELRTPLNAILGFSRLLRDDADLSLEQRKILDIINRSGEHLLSQINDVLDIAKVEAGRFSIDVTLVDLGEITRDIIDLLGARAKEKGLELRLDQSSSFPRFIRADGAKIRQVIINLVGNAVKFTERGRVTLRLSARPADAPHRLWLIAEVEDTGVGISIEDQRRIFDPFVQAGGLTLQKGTGLGLAIARSYMDLMGGRISVESAPGKGSIFRMEAPVERADEAEVRDAEIRRFRVVGLEPGQPEYRILIVEDQMENWLLLRKLMEDTGFSVRLAGNGAEGVEEFKAWRPHFIWMDIRMPVMDGLEASRRIRALDGGRDVKIAALTASVFKEERDHVLAAGMDDLIRKPYRSEEIFDCLERQLGVRFARKEASPASAAAPILALHPEALATLPADIRHALADALVKLDVVGFAELIPRVSEHDRALGEALTQHADRLSYTTMLQALKVIKDI